MKEDALMKRRRVPRGTYKITRIYENNQAPGKRTIKTGLTLEAAQAHCADPETSSKTCKLARNVRRTELRGPWFDGYDEETVLV